jgi:hypothetical protein
MTKHENILYWRLLAATGGEDTIRNFKHAKRWRLDRVHRSRAAGTDLDRAPATFPSGNRQSKTDDVFPPQGRAVARDRRLRSNPVFEQNVIRSDGVCSIEYRSGYPMGASFAAVLNVLKIPFRVFPSIRPDVRDNPMHGAILPRVTLHCPLAISRILSLASAGRNSIRLPYGSDARSATWLGPRSRFPRR